MKWIPQTLWIAVVLVASAVAAQAQAPACTGPLAEITSPAAGSTLPSGAVTFQWCNAGADYFLTIETVLGAHDIFNAVVRVTSVSLGPNCAATPPTGCIPTNGEPIYVTLWTQTGGGKTFQAAPLVTYTAASSGPVAPSPSTTTPANAQATFSSSAQSVNLGATVSSGAGSVNQGTVTFQVLDGTANIGSPVTSPTVANGSAGTTYLLPGGTAAKTYTIRASYSGGPNFDPSSGTGTLTVAPGAPAAAATTTTVNPQSVTFDSAAQDVTLTAAVASTSAVNEGIVSFQIVDASTTPVGTAASSATLSNGLASAVYRLPAGLAATTYTIQAAYSGGTNFDPSNGTGTLTVNPAPPPTQNVTTTNASNNAVTFNQDIQHVTLTAAVEVPGVVVNEGTVTFQVKDGTANIGHAVPSAALTDGSASVSYALPAALAPKNYTVTAAYSGGPDFASSSGSATLSVTKAQSTTQFTSTAPASLALNQTYTPVAVSTGDGTLTIAASGACSIAGATVTITATSGACDITATESDGPNLIGSSATQSIPVQPPDFSLATGTPSLTIGAVGGSGTISLIVTGQAGYNGTIAFSSTSCVGLPANSSCSFSPASVTGTGNTALTITTTASQSARSADFPVWWTTGGSIALAGAFLMLFRGSRLRWTMMSGLMVLALFLVAAGCGSGGSGNRAAPPPPATSAGTPTGSFTVTVTGTSGGTTHSTSFTLSVQ